MSENNSHYIQTIDRAVTLLKRAKKIISDTPVTGNVYPFKEIRTNGELISDIDDFLNRPVDVAQNQFHLEISNSTTKNLQLALGLSYNRAMHLADEIIDAFNFDHTMEQMILAGRSQCDLARILNRATQNCINVQESVFVTWMITMAWQQTTTDFSNAVKWTAQKAIH